MDEIIRSGFEPDQFIQGLADHMRDLLVCKDGRTIRLLDVSESLKSRYQHQAALASKSVLLTGLDILNQCDIALPRAKNKRLYTEIALSKINFANHAIESNLMPNQVSAEKKTEVLTESHDNHISSTQRKEQQSNPNLTEPLQNEAIVTNVNQSNLPQVDNKSQVPINVEVEDESKRAVPSPPIDTLKSEESKPTILEDVENKTEQLSSSPKSSTSLSGLAAEAKQESPDDDLLSFGKPSGIDDILASVVKEESQIEELRKGLNQETVQKLWSEYGSAHQSPSTKAMLELAILKLEGKTVHITVPSNHYKNMILEEDSLKELLRTKLGTPDLMMNPIVDRTAFPDLSVEKPKVLMSAKEKYQYLGEKHPPLRTLVEKLELRPDTGGDH